MTLSKNDLTQGTNPGIITKVYLNDKPEIASCSKSHGSYVIIETNTDYQGSCFPRSYAITMAADVKQEKPLCLKDKIITPSIMGASNYTEQSYVGYDPNTGKNRAPETYDYANAGTYTIAGLEGYQLHTIENGTPFMPPIVLTKPMGNIGILIYHMPFMCPKTIMPISATDSSCTFMMQVP